MTPPITDSCYYRIMDTFGGLKHIKKSSGNSFSSCTTDFAFSLQLAPFPSRLFLVLGLIKPSSSNPNHCLALPPLLISLTYMVIVYVISPYISGPFSRTPHYYRLSLIWTLKEVLSKSAIMRVDCIKYNCTIWPLSSSL